MSDDTDPSSSVRRRTVLILGVAGLVLVVDQATKAWAVAELADGPIRVFGSILALRLTRNMGGAFSLLTGFAPLLAIVAAVLAVVIVRLARSADTLRVGFALALVLGGALGNLTDRIVRAPGFLRGAVVDFIDLTHWPTFNVADSAITVGAVLLFLWSWSADRSAASRPGAD